MQFTILGGSGFLGRSLGIVAAARNLRVRSIARTSGIAAAGISYVQVKSYAQTPAPRGEDDVLIHLAQANSIDASQDARNAVSVVDLLLKLGYRKTCYASSAIVYGDRHTHPHRTEEVAAQLGDYAALKLACEDRFVAAGGMAVRFTNLYGKGLPRASVLWRILSQIPGSAPLSVKTLTPVRDFCWAEDAAAAVIDLCEAGARGIFNVGSGEATSIGELAHLALEVAGEQQREVKAEESASAASTLLVDISQTTAACGWRPETQLRAGLRRLVEERP